MTYDVQQALNEILDIPPMFRKEFIVRYLHENLPEEDARRVLFQKADYPLRLLEQGAFDRGDILERIGPERVKEYLYTTGSVK